MKITLREAAIIKRWKEFAAKNGLVLNSKPGYITAVAKICAKKGGACPCLPKKRPHCPCKEVFEDIKKMGCCHCMVFFDPNWKGEYGVIKKRGH